MLPGTYDLYYLNQSGGSDVYFSRSLSGRDLPYAKRLLETDVVVDASNDTITVDVETVPVTVNVTVDGQDPEVSTPYYDFGVWAVDQETGAWHQLVYYNQSYSSGNKVEATERMLPGTYDLYYLNQSGGSEKYYSRSLSGRDLPYANRLLTTDVVVDAANSTITVDVPTAAYSPTVLFDGQDPEVSTPYYDFGIWAPAVDTGAWHQLAYYNQSYSSGNRVEETTRIIGGTYHVAYYNQSGSSDKYFSRNLSGRETPYGVMYLDACVELP
jgi:ribosomal protein S17